MDKPVCIVDGEMYIASPLMKLSLGRTALKLLAREQIKAWRILRDNYVKSSTYPIELIEAMQKDRDSGMIYSDIKTKYNVPLSVVREYTQDGLRKRRTKDNRVTKLTSEQVVRIKERLANEESLRSIAKDYNVSYQTIGYIKVGRFHKCV